MPDYGAIAADMETTPAEPGVGALTDESPAYDEGVSEEEQMYAEKLGLDPDDLQAFVRACFDRFESEKEGM